MKKLLICCSLFLFSTFAFGSSVITSDGSVPEDVLAVFTQAAIEETYGRADLEIALSSYSESSNEGVLSIALMVSFSGKEILFETQGRGRGTLLDSIPREVRNLFFYESSLYSDGEMILDYSVNGSYSFLTRESMRRGTTLRAKDSLGETRALFEVSEMFGEAAVLEPVYLRDVYPGMELVDAGEWIAVGTAAMTFDFPRPEAMGLFSIGRRDLIYPFVPMLVVGYMYRDGMSYGYGGVGLEAYMDFARIFPSVQFTLVQEGRIGASASILVGGGPSGFDWRSVFSVFYEHRAVPSFFWRIGYQNMQGSHGLMIGMGGSF